MSNTKEKLFSEFQAPTKQEWLDKIGVDLKGADFQKRLVWKTPEGFSVQPFYQRDDVEKLSTPYSMPGEFPLTRVSTLCHSLSQETAFLQNSWRHSSRISTAIAWS